MALFPLGTPMGEQPEPALPSAQIWEGVQWPPQQCPRIKKQKDLRMAMVYRELYSECLSSMPLCPTLPFGRNNN